MSKIEIEKEKLSILNVSYDPIIYAKYESLLNVNHFISFNHTCNVLSNYKVNNIYGELLVVVDRANEKIADLDVEPAGIINPAGYAYLLFPHLRDETDIYRSYLHQYFRILKKLNNIDHKGWIIDLRANPGGLIEYFVSAIVPFVGAFELLAHNKKGEAVTKIKSNGKQFVFKTLDKTSITKVTLPPLEPIKNKKVNIIIDGATASAAEIVTVVLAKELSAVIYGTKSHGIISTVDSYETDNFTIEVPASQIISDVIVDEKIMPNFDTIPEEFFPNLFGDM